MKKTLFVIPIMILVAAGCGTKNQQQTTNQGTQNQTSGQAPSTSSIQESNNMVLVNDWGVEFQKPAGLEDLQYKIQGADKNNLTFSTQKLADLDKSVGSTTSFCTVDQAPIGVLSRTKDLASFGEHYVPTNVKIGDYYYWFTGPQAPCSENKQVQQLQTQQIQTLSGSILKNLRVISAK